MPPDWTTGLALSEFVRVDDRRDEGPSGCGMAPVPSVLRDASSLSEALTSSSPKK